jgi:4-amino-4-deoxy-L-arabinose transferase-like glycosyltransferase
VPGTPLTIRTAPAGRAVPAIAAAATVVLLAFAGGYGYHRDELYFVAAGRHLAWAYADQGPLTPLIARAMTELAPDSLVVLRVPPALTAGATVLLTGLLARELGGGRRAQAIAAACAAVAAVVLVTAVTWLAVRALRTGEDRLWLIAGLVLGVGLLNKPLPAFLAAGLLAGVALAGPRRLLRNPYVWAGAAIALALWSPWIAWQAGHGWPQIDVSRSIAAGGSASSQPWWAVVPFQLLLVSPPLAPVWIAGLVKLFADPALRGVRFLAWAWVVLAFVFMAAGGKPYYLAGLLPVLIAAGALAVDGWLERGRAGARAGALVAALAAAALADAVIALPVLPADRSGAVIAVDADAPTAGTTPTATGDRRPTAVRRSSRSGCGRRTSRTCAGAASPPGSTIAPGSTTTSGARPCWSVAARAARGRAPGRRCSIWADGPGR